MSSNQTITEITGHDVDFDQTIDSDTVTALAGGIAVNGDLDDSVVFTGRNDGIVAGDDVELDGSVLGNGNTQISDSTVGAFAARGNATNLQGDNVALGGNVTDVNTNGGDAQVIDGNGNQVFGDIDLDAEGAQGPINATFGNGNSSNALQDNSTTIEDSFNTDNSVEDSGNFTAEDSFNETHETTELTTLDIDDSFNSTFEHTEVFTLDIEESFVDNSVIEDNDELDLDLDLDDVIAF